MFKNGVEKLFVRISRIREFSNVAYIGSGNWKGILKQYKTKKKWLHARGINRWADKTRKIAIKLCGAAQKTQLNLPRESLALDGPKELWLLGKMTNARGSSLARGQNEGRLFRGWLPRARIYRKNERLVGSRGWNIERIEGHSARGIRNKNSSWFKFEMGIVIRGFFFFLTTRYVRNGTNFAITSLTTRKRMDKFEYVGRN